MENNKDILKWLNREISEEDFMRLKENEEFNTLDKIAHYSSHIETPKVNVSRALEEFKLKTKTSPKKGKVIAFNYKHLYKYAAAIVLLFTSSYFLFFNTNSNYKTTFAQTKNFNLPDNSEVILNANSEISYSKKEWKKSRNLNLEGEAYFKVKKGKKFTVQTKMGNITVLGTQFNIKERKNYFEVKTYEGLVSVTYKNKLLKLAKGQLFRVVNGNIDTLNTFNVNSNSWLQKESNFKSTPLHFVLDDLQNQYNYKIITKDVNLENLYTGGFTHTNIQIALEAITVPLQLSYLIEGKKVTIFKNDK